MMALVAPKIHLAGKLSEDPFPRVLQYLHERNVTGRLKLERGKVVKEIFLVEGRPVNVESNLRDETLGRFLVKTGKINEDEFEKSVQLMIEQNIQQGAALVKLGLVSPKELYHQVKDQTRKKMLTSFSWPEGSFSFSPGVDFVEDIYRFEMPTPRLMYDGVMGYLPAGLVERELARTRSGPILPIAGFFNQIGVYDLDEVESAFVMAIDGEKDLAGLRESIPAFSAAPRLLYLLLLSGLIGVGGEPEKALREVGEEDLTMPAVEDLFSTGVREPPVEADEPAPPEAVPAEPQPIPFEEPPAPADEDKPPPKRYLDLSDDEVVDEWEPPRDDEAVDEGPPSRARTPLLIEEDPIEEDPIEVGESDEGPEEPDQADEILPPALAEPDSDSESPPTLSFETVPEEDLRDESEILEYYMGIKNLDFFRMLEVSPESGDEEVTQSYQDLRARYYKHRFPADLSLEVQDKLEEIQAQIIRAYEQLRTATGRQAYLLAQKKTATKAPTMKDKLRAEQFLQRGMAHVRKREWSHAQAMFEEAVTANPTDPEYLGYLGWTIYSNTGLDLGERRDRAKELLKEAIQLNPHSDSAHVFLGKIYKDEAKAEEAVNEFELAVLCNPKCKEAEREIQRHEDGEW